MSESPREQANVIVQQLDARVAIEKSNGASVDRIGLIETAKKLAEIVIVHEGGVRPDLQQEYHVEFEGFAVELILVVMSIIDRADRLQ
jgi:hypothetical protein